MRSHSNRTLKVPEILRMVLIAHVLSGSGLNSPLDIIQQILHAEFARRIFLLSQYPLLKAILTLANGF